MGYAIVMVTTILSDLYLSGGKICPEILELPATMLTAEPLSFTCLHDKKRKRIDIKTVLNFMNWLIELNTGVI